MIKSRRMRLAECVARMVKKRNSYRVLMENKIRKRPLVGGRIILK
jgi:hypothetical protein